MPGKKQKLALPEVLLHMAQLHVEKGRERIARQERVIADLERDRRDGSLPKAHDVLVFLRSVQVTAEADLALKRRGTWEDGLAH